MPGASWFPVTCNVRYNFTVDPRCTLAVWSTPTAPAPIQYLTCPPDAGHDRSPKQWIWNTIDPGSDPNATAGKPFLTSFYRSVCEEYLGDPSGSPFNTAPGCSVFFQSEHGWVNWTQAPWKFLGDDSTNFVNYGIHLLDGQYSSTIVPAPFGTACTYALGPNTSNMYGPKSIDCLQEAHSATGVGQSPGVEARPALRPIMLQNMLSGSYSDMETAYADTDVTSDYGYLITAQNIMAQCDPVPLSGAGNFVTTFDYHTLDKCGYPPYGVRVGQSTNGETYPPVSPNWHIDGSMQASLNPGTPFIWGQGIQLVENTHDSLPLQMVVSVRCNFLCEIPSSKLQLLLSTPEYQACNSGLPATNYPTGYMGTRAFQGFGSVPHLQRAQQNIRTYFPAAPVSTIATVSSQVAQSSLQAGHNPTTTSVPTITTPSTIAVMPVINTLQGALGSRRDIVNTTSQTSGRSQQANPGGSMLNSLASGVGSALPNLLSGQSAAVPAADDGLAELSGLSVPSGQIGFASETSSLADMAAALAAL